MGEAGSGPRPPPARRLRWLGGGSAGLLLPTVLTCTQGRVTSPASPPQLAASRRSASVPEASAALRAPQSRGHGLSDTSSPGESAASSAGAVAAASAPLWSPSHHLAETLSRPRGYPFSSSPRGSWDRRTDAGIQGRTAGSGKVTPGCAAGLGRARSAAAIGARAAATTAIPARWVSLVRRSVTAPLARGGTMGWAPLVASPSPSAACGALPDPLGTPGTLGSARPSPGLRSWQLPIGARGGDRFLIATGSWKGEGRRTLVPVISTGQIHIFAPPPPPPTPGTPCRGGGGCSLQGSSRQAPGSFAKQVVALAF